MGTTLNRETNPTQGFSRAVLPQHFDTGGQSMLNTGKDNPLPVLEYGSSTGSYGVTSIAAANTAQQLPAFACHEVTLIGVKTNNGTIYVGLDANVTDINYGVALDPKDSMTFRVANVDQLYVYGAAGDGVSYVAI